MIKRLIGDTHGKIPQYSAICAQAELDGIETISLGDNGFFEKWTWYEQNLSPSNHRLLMGNHDDTGFVNSPLSLGHFGIFDGLFFIRGAFSIDRSRRILGRDWFLDEELNTMQERQCMELWEKIKPHIVISHDCPSSVCEELFGIYTHSNTRKFLQALYEIHQPSQWYFGHFHLSKHLLKNNTYFRCLAELETIDIDY